MHLVNSSSEDATLQRVRSHQSILVDFARVAAGATDLQRLLGLACQHAARATGVAHSKVMQARQEKGDLVLLAGKGWAQGVIGHTSFGMDMRSPPGRCYQTRDAVRSGHLPDDTQLRLSPFLRAHQIQSVLNAPIAIDGVVWGVLEVDSTQPDRFDDDDSRFLLGFGLVLALAIRNHQAQEERETNAADLGRRIQRADTLLSEQNHRVRNYFQLILGILASRSRRTTEARIREEHTAVMERITAIALAHDQLSIEGQGQTHVGSVNYIEALCTGLERTSGGELRIARYLEPMKLRADRAVPMGLVLNELLINAIKYAVKGRDEAKVEVRFTSLNDGTEAVLQVSDDGPGLGNAREGSVGLKLIESLAGQLSGRLEVTSSSSGTTVIMQFPLVE